MRRIVFIAFFVGIFVLSAKSTSACWCGMPDVRESFDKANAVFTGEVIDVVESLTTDEKASRSQRFYTIKFKNDFWLEVPPLKWRWIMLHEGDPEKVCDEREI